MNKNINIKKIKLGQIGTFWPVGNIPCHYSILTRIEIKHGQNIFYDQEDDLGYMFFIPLSKDELKFLFKAKKRGINA